MTSVARPWSVLLPRSGWRGSRMRNVVPPPTRVSSSMLPRCCVTMAWTTDSPSPVPSAAALVVKNGSKIWSRRSSAIPWPVSATSNQTLPSGLAARAHGQDATGRHGVGGVDRQVHDHLLDLAAIGVHEEWLVGEVDLEPDRLTQQPAHEGRRIGDHGAQIEALRARRLAPREDQELARQPGAALRVLGQLDEAFLHGSPGRTPAWTGPRRSPG